MSTPTTKPKAAIGAKKSNVPRVLACSKVVYNAILLALATLFLSPPISMPAFLLLIEALDTAEQQAGTKTRGLAAVRNGKRDALWTALLSLRVYVQSLCDVVVPEAAIAIIEAAGMVVGRV